MMSIDGFGIVPKTTRTEQWKKYDTAILVADEAWAHWETVQKIADGLELEARAHDGQARLENYKRAMALNSAAEEDEIEEARTGGQFGHGA